MAEIKTQPVKGTLVADIDDDSTRPGDFELSGDPVGGLWYNCPCGCGSQGFLPIRPAASPSWEWDGNREAPTLNPSVNHVGHWHGWLRNGVWESC